MSMGVSSYNRARTQTSQWEEPGVTLGFKTLAALSRTYKPVLVESWKTVLRIR